MSKSILSSSDSLISKDVAEAMIKKYKSRAHNPLLKDTHYTWFSIEGLSCYLEAIKNNPNINADGCRIYFAVHNDGHTHPNPRNQDQLDDYSDRLCIVFVPTKSHEISGILYHAEVVSDDVDLNCDAAFNKDGVIKDFGTLCPPHSMHLDESIYYTVYEKP